MNPRRLVESIGRDLRHGFRSIYTNLGYSFVIVFTLAICIGTNTVIFSIVNSVLLRPLPVPDADEILLMANRYPKAGAGETAWSAGADYYDRIRDVTTLEDQALFNTTSRILETGAGAERLAGMVATPSLFRLLRVAPQHGRAFDDTEGEIGNEFKVILSHATWQRLYAFDRDVIGRDIRLSGRSYAIVGVMPEGFLFYDPEVCFWIPLALTPEQASGRHSNNWFNVGRLEAGATIQQVQSQLNALNAANLDRLPQMREFLVNVGFETKVIPLKDYLVRDIKGHLHLLWGGAALVLLIGAMNVAGLVVARTSARSKEMGTRLALGAGLGRLSSQLIAENLVLSNVGGILGLALAHALVHFLRVSGLHQFPRSGEVRVDVITALFAFVISILAGLFIALLSIAHLSRLSLIGALTDFSRTSTGGRRTSSVRKGLVIAQVGLTFVLLTGAALLLASFRELLRVQPGYDTEGILTASTSISNSRYPGAAELNTLISRSLNAIRSIPGVVDAGATSAIPLSSGSYNDAVIFAEGYVMKPGESILAPLYIGVTPGYFDAMGVRLLRGRYFDSRDTENSPSVVIIDKGLVEKFWPGLNPVGRRMFQPTGPALTRTDSDTRWLRVVGVVDSVRTKNLAGTGNDAGAYYYPFSQSLPRNVTFAIKTRTEPANFALALRKVIAEIDPILALFDVRTMVERASASLASQRTTLMLSLSFAAISLLQASIGLYGVLSYLLVQRRREIAIRMAVGCTPGGISYLFLREAAILVSIGVFSGVVVAAIGHGVVERFLYGVQALEPAVLASVGLVLAIIALLATAGPARQAARVDPASALNDQ